MSEFEVFEVTYCGMAIGLRIRWIPLPGLGAVRMQDRLHWESARQCRSCQTLGYDHDDIDAVLEAHRLGVDHAPRVAACGACTAPTCDTCADPTGTMCLRCHARGPGA